jgi:hypothetical protein
MSKNQSKSPPDAEKQLDELIRRESNEKVYSNREITRVQAPTPWPDPPPEKNGDKED